jgi:flavin-dependent dehydrogenase
MAGDAAGMITPLCGNGMAMAIHAAKICSELVTQYLSGEISREEMEQAYAAAWNDNFKIRHWAGRKIQSLFGGSFASNLAVNLGKISQTSATFLMKQTHGVPF